MVGRDVCCKPKWVTFVLGIKAYVGEGGVWGYIISLKTKMCQVAHTLNVVDTVTKSECSLAKALQSIEQYK
jgi:hypothetical protein